MGKRYNFGLCLLLAALACGQLVAATRDLQQESTRDAAIADSKGCYCTAIYDPVCGKNGKQYSSACQAACSNVQVAYKGECQAKPTNPSGGEIKCLKNSQVICLVDPCKFATCSKHPRAVCLGSDCKGTIYGTTVTPCQAVFVANKRVVQC